MSTTEKYAERVRPIWDEFKEIEKNIFLPDLISLKQQIKKAINKAFQDGFKAGLRESNKRRKEKQLDMEW